MEPAPSLLHVALACRCPRCGQGRLFRNLLVDASGNICDDDGAGLYAVIISTNAVANSLTVNNASAIVADIGRGLHTQGARGLIIVNGHFGNREPAARAARELHESLAFPVLLLDYPGLEQLASEICSSESLPENGS